LATICLKKDEGDAADSPLHSCWLTIHDLSSLQRTSGMKMWTELFVVWAFVLRYIVIVGLLFYFFVMPAKKKKCYRAETVGVVKMELDVMVGCVLIWVHRFHNRYLITYSTGCPTRYRNRHFFNNFITNENIATKFEAHLTHCVRNEKKKNLFLFKFCCNIFIGVRIIKEMPASVASGTLCIYSAFGKSLCTYKRCWKWCPQASIQAWTRLILFANTFCRSACEMFLFMYAIIAVFNPLSVRGRSRYTVT
jgi:hypothetical protein